MSSAPDLLLPLPVLVLVGESPAPDDLLSHARSLARPGRVTVRTVGGDGLAAAVRAAMAGSRFSAVLVGVDDPAVGECGARELADALGEGGPPLLVLCPPGDDPPAL
jgi:hypothetical protein